MVFGSTLLLKLMERFPIIITLGAALLGWVAGDMATTDPAVKDWVDANMPWLHTAAGARRRRRRRDRQVARVAVGRAARATGPIVDLAVAGGPALAQARPRAPRRVLLVADDSAGVAART